MRILVTGAKGFLGKNLIWKLRNIQEKKAYQPGLTSDLEIIEFDIDSSTESLEEYCRRCNFVFHLAGVNRPDDTADFVRGNVDFTAHLLSTLETCSNPVPVVLASSIQADCDNPYGRSKKAGEELVFKYADRYGMQALVYRFPNLFGKWSRPYYNSVIATFCYNLSREIPIEVSDPSVEMELCYIDDVVDELLRALESNETRIEQYCTVPISYHVTLGQIVNLLESFRAGIQNKSLPNVSDLFEKKLYSTWLSFLPQEKLYNSLQMNTDFRGSFTEIFRTPDRGQISVNVIKPDITKGNHWHHTKTEKFVVVAGEGCICFHNLLTGHSFKHSVRGKAMEVVDIPPGYVHSIENTGKQDLVLLIWSNECFDSNRPDTFSCFINQPDERNGEI